MAIGNVRKSTAGLNFNKMKGLKITDLLVPGLFIMVFTLLTIFVYVPSLSDSNAKRLELREVRSKQKDLEDNLEALQPLINNKSGLHRDLIRTESIIPQNLDVADFSYYVDKLARQSGLDFREITQQNSNVSNSVQSKLKLSNLVSSVKGPIVYQGTYDQIVEFLDLLQKESPYIVEVVDLGLRRTVKTEEELEEEGANEEVEDDGIQLWDVELSIAGYFIPNDSEVSLGTIYQRITPYTQYSEEMEIFEYKAAILDERGDQSTPDDRDESPDETTESE